MSAQVYIGDLWEGEHTHRRGVLGGGYFLSLSLPSLSLLDAIYIMASALWSIHLGLVMSTARIDNGWFVYPPTWEPLFIFLFFLFLYFGSLWYEDVRFLREPRTRFCRCMICVRRPISSFREFLFVGFLFFNRRSYIERHHPFFVLPLVYWFNIARPHCLPMRQKPSAPALEKERITEPPTVPCRIQQHLFLPVSQRILSVHAHHWRTEGNQQ